MSDNVDPKEIFVGVTFEVKLDDVAIGTFTSCEGLGIEVVTEQREEGGNNGLVCNLGTIANGAQQTVTVVVRPNLVTRGTTLTNGVTVATETTEIDTTNNSATETTEVASPSVDLLINKDDSIDPLTVGDDTVYSVTVTNLGPSAAENVVVTDSMPPTRIAYRSHVVPADGSCSTVHLNI